MKKFATVLNCIDGRTQMPVFHWAKKEFGVLFVDTITEPGVDGMLAGTMSAESFDEIKKKILISSEKHGSDALCIAGHEECAGNPVSNEQHKIHIQAAAEKLFSLGFMRRVVGVLVHPSFGGAENDWDVEIVSDLTGHI